ncbi:unnamed protein product [Mytilus edulis]|uniref:Integrase catalytic domain-containing protein n=1 Tax=Mytilus edulis TaxID=6550 RepID=A0A8S3SLQ1_MYTED|nr:unnamed protein product [Mytilus edulis]
MGNTCGIWDNGFYTKGYLQNLPLTILIDNGSTSSILNYKIYRQLADVLKNAILEPSTYKLFDVNGNPLCSYGTLKQKLTLGTADFNTEFLVCDIKQDAILGQDFLLDHIDKIDYKRQILSTKDTDIRCWIGGEANAICRVIVNETVTLPGKSKMLLPVIIENAEHLGPLGYVDKTQKKETEHIITRGILDPHQEDIRVQLINFREEPITVHAKEQIGVCESYYEMPAVGVCNYIGTEGTSSDKLPSHIEDLFNRSIVHLQKKEKQHLKELLKAYSDVFAKSADDLGRNNRVQHRINTGTAHPIRQAHRRLPLGKREIEKKEIVKMLDRGVIEPSNSPWSFRTVLTAKKDGSTRGFADLSRPLHKACDKGTKFIWTENCQLAFNSLKEALTTPPILVYPVTDKPFILDTDASNYAVGAVLSQEHDGREHVIAYMSKALNKHEISYCTTRKELPSCNHCLKEFSSIRVWAGRKHTNADAMSRNPCKSCKHQQDLNQAENYNAKEESEHLVECHSNLEKQEEAVEHLATPLTEADETPDTSELTGLIPGNIRAVTRSELKEQQNEMKVNEALLGGWEPSEIRQQQLEDDNIGKVFAAFESGSQKPPWESISSGTSALKTLWGQWDRLEMHGGVLYRRSVFKWTEAIALPNQESSTICTAFIDHFVTKFGAPLQLHSDQGRNFQADIFQRMCNLLGIHQKPEQRVSDHNPTVVWNVLIEHLLLCGFIYLSMYCKQKQDQWDQYLQQVMMAYRSSVHASTSKTPNSMLFGREVTLPLQAVIPQPDTEIQENRSPDDYVAHLQNKLKENHAFARKALKKVSIYQKKRYDLNAKKRFFKRGKLFGFTTQ